MNRSQAKNLLPIIQAFAEGKEIEYRSKGFNEEWREMHEMSGLSFDSHEYRIKTEPKYRPFANIDECWQEMQKHKPFGWVKDKNKEDGTYVMVTKVSDGRDDMVINGNYNWRLDGLLECFTFADGTPFGIKEK